MSTEEQFRTRWAELALAETAVQLAADATITPLTLAQVRSEAGAHSGRGSERALPRISLDLGGSTGSDSAHREEHGRSADLAVVGQLGEGGMGRVHLARQHSLGRDVAVKSLKEHATTVVSDALLREARITGALEHPGVIPVHALGLDDAGRPLLVMKRVEGVEWRMLMHDPEHRLWSDRGTRGLEGNLEILMQVSQTVQFSHSRRVLHLDIKPENVMVGAYGEVYLVDWGIAAPLADPAVAPDTSRALVGTPAYMAPEMVLGGALDVRTDVYLLGATLHEVLSQSQRHAGTKIEAVLLAAALSKPVSYDAGVPPELAELANRATAQDPSLRPESAAAFRDALASYLRRRSTNAISDAASARLGELERALEEAPESEPPRDLGSAYRLISEARFGFSQALREMPEHADARAGAQRAVEALIDLELRQQHAETARALLREVDSPEPALVQRLEAAELQAGKARRETERLHALDRDLDPTVAATPRIWALSLLVFGILAIFAYFFATGGVSRVGPRGLLVIALVVALFSTLGLVWLRRELLSQTFNRRMASLVMVIVYGTLANRLVANLTGASVQSIVLVDLAIILGVSAGAAVLLPWLWTSVVLLAGAVGLAETLPQYSIEIFSYSMILNATLTVFVFWRWSKRAVARAD